MRKSFSILAVTAALALAQASAAGAASAVWEKLGQWTIMGHTDSQSCTASTLYDTGRILSVIFVNEMASVMVTNIEVRKGRTYSVIMRASTGQSGVMEAYAVDNQSVVFHDINRTAVRALADARMLYIQGLGTFELTGSKRAMASAWRCYEALNSF